MLDLAAAMSTGQTTNAAALAMFYAGLQAIIRTQGHERALEKLDLARATIERGACCEGRRIYG